MVFWTNTTSLSNLLLVQILQSFCNFWFYFFCTIFIFKLICSNTCKLFCVLHVWDFFFSKLIIAKWTFLLLVLICRFLVRAGVLCDLVVVWRMRWFPPRPFLLDAGSPMSSALSAPKFAPSNLRSWKCSPSLVCFWVTHTLLLILWSTGLSIIIVYTGRIFSFFFFCV